MKVSYRSSFVISLIFGVASHTFAVGISVVRWERMPQIPPLSRLAMQPAT